MTVNLVWITPDAEQLITHIARVSAPGHDPNEPRPKLLRYLIDNAHWSPFEMASACVEINTTRDISRQILRHRSFSFQEFSGRYSQHDLLEPAPLRECRLQDTKNRQNSLACEDLGLIDWWYMTQQTVLGLANELYTEALEGGIAKEQARAILPEGLTPTRMYMSGTIRSWIHYWELRCDEATQKEHRLLANQSKQIILSRMPILREILEAKSEVR